MQLNLKKVVRFQLLALSFLLFGCQEVTKEENVIPEVPYFQVLTDESGNVLGKAFLAKKNIWVTPDHLYETTPNLFCAGQKISILARDFERDLLAFSFKSQKEVKPLSLSKNPPEVGKPIYWYDGEQKASTIIAANILFQTHSQTKENLMSFSGETVPGASGSVILDGKGVVLGMIIGADRDEGTIFGVRSDNIIRFITSIEIE